MKTLNKFLISKETNIDDYANKIREEILNNVILPVDKTIDFICEKIQGLDSDEKKVLVDKIFKPIYKEDKPPYNYLLFQLSVKYSDYIDICKDSISYSKKEIEKGIEVGANMEEIEVHKRDIKDINLILDLLNNIMREYNKKKNFISIAFLNKYIHENSCYITDLIFPEGSKYEDYCFVVPEELIESNENHIHEKYISYNKNKCWIVLPNGMNVTLRNKWSNDFVVISTNELKEAVKRPFEN